MIMRSFLLLLGSWWLEFSWRWLAVGSWVDGDVGVGVGAASA